MKFGKVEHPENIDFTLPETHEDTFRVLENIKSLYQNFMWVAQNGIVQI